MEKKALKLDRSIAYVTRDIERALGIEPGRHGNGDYIVVTNDTAYGRSIYDAHRDHVVLVKNSEMLDTYDLLALPEVQKMIADHGADLLVFQNTLRIERLAAEKKWNLLNPSATLAKTVEEKITQTEWLGGNKRHLPPFAIAAVRDVFYSGKRFVLQFNHAHTGQGTYIIDSAADLAHLKERFPDRECRVTDFIDGPVFTVNALVSRGKGAPSVTIGNPSYQITGLAPFTDVPLSTVGNDWSLARRPEFESFRIDSTEIAQSVGAWLKKSGWKGLFGLDFVYDPKAQKTYLLEINSRQAASATYESQLMKKARAGGLSLFECHIAVLTGQDALIDTAPLPNIDGAQIVQRVTDIPRTVDVAALRARGFAVIEYENSLRNKELFRIQSTAGIMESHGRLNDRGNLIMSLIK